MLAASACVYGGAVRVNGVCEVGNCASPDVVGSGNSLLTPFNFTFTFGNGDQYQINGSFTVTNSGGFFITAPFGLSYIGPGGASAGTDVLTVDLLQNVATTVTSGAFNETLRGSFGSGLGAGSSVQGEISFGGQALPLQGPVSPPNAFDLTVSGTQLTNMATNPLLIDEQRVFTFGAGSAIGASIANNETVPEPGTFVPLGAGLLILAARRCKTRPGRA